MTEAGKPKQQFSFDIYPGLNSALDEALAGAPGGDTAGSELDQAAREAVQRSSVGVELDPKVRDWAYGELEAVGSIDVWSKFDASDLGVEIPKDLEDLLRISPNLVDGLGRLYEAQRTLMASSEVTPGGINVGQSMRLVLVPWQAFERHIDGMPGWLAGLRPKQGVKRADKPCSELWKAIIEGTPMYRVEGRLVSAVNYLRDKQAQDGPWGVVLAQVGRDVGIRRLMTTDILAKSPLDLTSKWTKRFEVAGQPVDGLGIFEWLSMTLQEPPKSLSDGDYTWLLANRLDKKVLVGAYDYSSDPENPKEQVISEFAHQSEARMLPRLGIV